MIIDFKRKTKRLLQGSLAKLLVITLLSFVLRYGVVALFTASLYFAAKSTFYSSLAGAYGEIAVGIGFYSLCALIFSACVLWFFGLMLGENMCFFERASGKQISIKSLFQYLSPYTCTQGALLYTKLYTLKLLWLLLFATPCIACVYCLYILISQSLAANTIYYILSAAASVVASASLIMWRISSLRYLAAPYIFCLREEKDAKAAIQKSILYTDEFLTEAVSNEVYLFFKGLNFIFILPIAYLVVYTKLFKRVFVAEAIHAELIALKLSQNVD